jgi:hypothetical protein
MYFNGWTALVGLGLLFVIEVSRSHTCTHTHTHKHTTLNSTPLDEGSDCRKDLYLTTHDTHTKQTSMPQSGFEPAMRASERHKTHVLDRAAIGIGLSNICYQLIARRKFLLEKHQVFR